MKKQKRSAEELEALLAESERWGEEQRAAKEAAERWGEEQRAAKEAAERRGEEQRKAKEAAEHWGEEQRKAKDLGTYLSLLHSFRGFVWNLKFVTKEANSHGSASAYMRWSASPSVWVEPKQDLVHFLEKTSEEPAFDWSLFASAVKELSEKTSGGETELVHPLAHAFLTHLPNKEAVYFYSEPLSRGGSAAQTANDFSGMVIDETTTAAASLAVTSSSSTTAQTTTALPAPAASTTTVSMTHETTALPAPAASTTTVSMTRDDSLSRRPDFLFGSVLTTSDSKLTESLQRRALLSVECKRLLVEVEGTFSMDNAYSTALREVARDYGWTLSQAMPQPNANLPYFFAIVCDGVRWQLLRLRLRDVSVEMQATRVYNLTKVSETSEFFSLCYLALQCARKRWTYEFAIADCPVVALPIDSVASPIDSVLAVGDDTAVLHVSSSRATIVKIALSPSRSQRLQVEAASRTSYEGLFVDDKAKYLLKAEYKRVLDHDTLTFVYSGERSVQSIFDADINTDVFAWARIVKRDVGAALAVFHKHSLTFADIHPGNIVIGDDGVAKLIDWECVCATGTPVSNNAVSSMQQTKKRIMFRRGFIPPEYNKLDAQTSSAGDLTSLLLVLAWIIDFNEFRSKIGSAASGVSEAGDNEWRSRCQQMCSARESIEKALE
jgi:hypothetical protein